LHYGEGDRRVPNPAKAGLLEFRRIFRRAANDNDQKNDATNGKRLKRQGCAAE